MTTGRQQELELTCASCDTPVEVCAFCDGTDCGHTVCARCLRIELRESLPHPHDHGG